MVMIKPPGREVAEHRAAKDGHEDGEQRTMRPGQLAGHPRRQGQQAGEQQQRKGQLHQPLRRLRIGEELKEPGQRRDGRIDNACPVHEHAMRRIHAPRGEIKPALPVHQVARLQHAHRVVWIGEQAGRHEALNNREGQGGRYCQPCRRQHGNGDRRRRARQRNLLAHRQLRKCPLTPASANPCESVNTNATFHGKG